jgi:hypothetical protein
MNLSAGYLLSLHSNIHQVRDRGTALKQSELDGETRWTRKFPNSVTKFTSIITNINNKISKSMTWAVDFTLTQYWWLISLWNNRLNDKFGVWVRGFTSFFFQSVEDCQCSFSSLYPFLEELCSLYKPWDSLTNFAPRTFHSMAKCKYTTRTT